MDGKERETEHEVVTKTQDIYDMWHEDELAEDDARILNDDDDKEDDE